MISHLKPSWWCGVRRVVSRILMLIIVLGGSFESVAEVSSALPAGTVRYKGLVERVAFPSTPLVEEQVTVNTITVEIDRRHAPADGQSVIEIAIKLLDAKGVPINDSRYVSVSVDGGRLLFEGDLSQTIGPEPRNVDRAVRSTQLKVEEGEAYFRLLAPTNPQAVKLRITSGTAIADTTIDFLPELRSMMAIGLIEGVISKRNMTLGAINQEHMKDGFEREINHWSRDLGSGGRAAARTAFFLKGTISGQTLLTAAYDSDKDTRNHLMRDVNPERFYPVYGDSSVKGFDARSSDRLYVRIDHNKNYLLYGDFATGSGFSQATSGWSVANQRLRDLGQYNRTATGLRGHYEVDNVMANTFAIYDTLKQVVEEYPGNGTSGPFAVRNSNAVENSEKIEIIVRDKNQLGLIKQIKPLTRFADYTFEPFSGRILFTLPIATLTPDGDPQFFRITYETDLGGQSFWVVGADGQVKINNYLALGGALIDDTNPLSPYRLSSVNASAKLGENTSLVLEFAQAQSTLYSAAGEVFATPSGSAGELESKIRGNAGRLELIHSDERVNLRAYVVRTDTGFNNPAASLMGGKGEAGIRANLKASDLINVFGEVIRSEDRVLGAVRQGQQLGLAYQVSDQLTLNAALTHTREDTLLPATAQISSNTALLGSGMGSTGGFFGGSQAVPPVGSTLNTTASQLTQPLEATTVKAGAQYKATERFNVNAELERGVVGNNQTRLVLGSEYQLTEQVRLYDRFETQRGLASAYSLNPADSSTSFIAGVSSNYMPGGNLFSEYRARDATAMGSSRVRDMALATGERHTWNVDDGIVATTGVEYLKILQGNTQNALALSAGLDYSVDPLWRASTKLEYRRLFQNPVVAASQGQNQWLSTTSFARKLDRDWTLLLRNYLLFSQKNYNASGLASGNALQDRAQIGFAWRPTDNNRYNALARYEFKVVNDQSQLNGDNYRTHIVSLHGDYHPSRPWWMTARIAGKATTDFTLPVDSQLYEAWLLSGRVVYDVNQDWDVGVLLSTLNSPQGGSNQYAYGTEVGYLLTKNLWASAGYNLMGFTDRDLSGADYTARGAYLRLRFKFDENTFKSGGS
ncbi:MAG: hypothetical protein IT497_08780 [Ottowia sp.]|nr:hypothetical protein [Ottowia sp.]